MSGHIILLTLAACFLWLGGRVAINYYLFFARGWKIAGEGRDHIAYVERGKGRIVFPADLMGRGPVCRVVGFPSPEKWNRDSPSWAHNRRDEIVQRIKQVMPEPKYEYVES